MGLVRIAQDPTDQQRLNTPSLHAAWRVPYYVTLDHSDALQWAVQRWICTTLNTQRATRQISALSLAVVIVLYLAHALPLYFYNVALPAILRHQGVDLRWIGMLSLLYIPWAFKFLWAPLIDRLYIKKLGKRKTWLLFTQVALVLGVLALAFTQFSYGLAVFVVIGLWISSFAATQDIAIDGYTVETFSASEYRLGSMAQV